MAGKGSRARLGVTVREYGDRYDKIFSKPLQRQHPPCIASLEPEAVEPPCSIKHTHRQFTISGCQPPNLEASDAEQS